MRKFFAALSEEGHELAFDLLLKTGLREREMTTPGREDLKPRKRIHRAGPGAEASLEFPQQDRQGTDGAIGCHTLDGSSRKPPDCCRRCQMRGVGPGWPGGHGFISAVIGFFLGFGFFNKLLTILLVSAFTMSACLTRV